MKSAPSWRAAVAAALWMMPTVVLAESSPPIGLQTMCPSVYEPVCAEKAGDSRTFGNACLARREGFAVTAEGRCGGGSGLPRFCTREYRPVCGEKNGARRMFGNACEAAAEDYTVVREGSC
jgi:hypothetical protein